MDRNFRLEAERTGSSYVEQAEAGLRLPGRARPHGHRGGGRRRGDRDAGACPGCAAPTSTCPPGWSPMTAARAAGPRCAARRAPPRRAAPDAGGGAGRDGWRSPASTSCSSTASTARPTWSALRQHIALAARTACRSLVRVGEGEPGADPAGARPGRDGIVAPHIDIGRRGRGAGRRGALPAARHPRLRHLLPRRPLRLSDRGRAPRRGGSTDTLVFGMIESPAGVAAADDRRGARHRREHDRHRRPGRVLRPTTRRSRSWPQCA